MAARGLDEVWVRYLDLIRQIPPGGCTVTELAERVGLSKQTVGPLVRELAEAGIAVIEPHPDDRRARLVRQGPAAAPGLARVETAIEAVTGRYRERMGPEGFDELEEGLWLMLDTVEESEKSRSRGVP